MNPKAKTMLTKISEATVAIAKSESNPITQSRQFNTGYRFGLEEAARVMGISWDEIIKAEDAGMLAYRNQASSIAADKLITA